jgi:hypothetical protein
MKSTFRLLHITLTVVSLAGTTGLRAEEPIRLREIFPEGYQYHVSTRVELSGRMTLPAVKDKPAPKPLTVSGDSALDYDERILKCATDGQVEKSARVYQRMDFQRKIGDHPQKSSLRTEVRRLVILRNKNLEVPFSPDGPLTWGEIDLVHTDVYTPALTGLLADHPVTVGDRWKASSGAVQELTDLESIEEGELECCLEQVVVLEKRRQAKVAFSGTVRGVNEDGPNRQQLNGYFYFDLESNHLSYLYLKGVHILIDKDGQEVGRIEGRFVLTRQLSARNPDLSDEALKALTLEPTPENTLMLYDSVDQGARFLYPRRWRLAEAGPKQIALASADGSGLLLTLEAPEGVPTGAQFLKESRDWLEGQKAKILRVDSPESIQDKPRELQRFALEVEIGGQRVLMDYFVARQAKGGATLAARLPTTDQAALRKEVEGIARSLVISGPASRGP